MFFLQSVNKNIWICPSPQFSTYLRPWWLRNLLSIFHSSKFAISGAKLARVQLVPRSFWHTFRYREYARGTHEEKTASTRCPRNCRLGLGRRRTRVVIGAFNKKEFLHYLSCILIPDIFILDFFLLCVHKYIYNDILRMLNALQLRKYFQCCFYTSSQLLLHALA